jgi:hypothetical protein
MAGAQAAMMPPNVGTAMRSTVKPYRIGTIFNLNGEAT